jgi:hypothetical protein
MVADVKVWWKVQRYLIDVSSFVPKSWGIVANDVSLIEFGVHVVVVGSLWLGELWTVWLSELGY